MWHLDAQRPTPTIRLRQTGWMICVVWGAASALTAEGGPRSSGLTDRISVSAEPRYDVVIRHGRIVDGTGNPWSHGDPAIQGDRIAAISEIPTDAAQRAIDATGLVVAPGFIDIHSHSDTLLLEDGSAQSKIRQGVTTEILGEGESAGPSKGQPRPRPRFAIRRIFVSEFHEFSPGAR